MNETKNKFSNYLKSYLQSGKIRSYLILLLLIATIIVAPVKILILAFNSPDIRDSKTENYINHYNEVISLSQNVNNVVAEDDFYNNPDQWRELNSHIRNIENDLASLENDPEFDNIYLAETKWINSISQVIELGSTLANISNLNSSNETEYNNLVSQIELTNNNLSSLNIAILNSLDQDKESVSVSQVYITAPTLPTPILLAKQQETEELRIAEAQRQAEAQRIAAEEAQRQAEAQRLAEEAAQRQAEEQRLAEEAARQAQEAENTQLASSEEYSYNTDDTYSGTFILNTNTGKLHKYPGCSAVARMKESNKQIFEGTIYKSDYDLCKNCF